jgi:hypothetical protein
LIFYFFSLITDIPNIPDIGFFFGSDYMVLDNMYSALPDVYGQLHLIPNTQNISLKSWWVDKIIEHGF